MANLNDLPLNADKIPDVIVEDQPVLGTFTPPPQPGTYVFRLPPPAAIFNCFEVDETSDQGQRLRASLRDEAALYNESLGESYSTNLSNRVRYVKRGDDRIAVSDMAMVLNAVKSFPENNTNVAYGNALVEAAGRRFRADSTLTANCNPNRDIYRDGAVVPGVKGCGWKYAAEAYMDGQGRQVRAIPRDENNLVSLRFQCLNPKCSAEVRSWGQLKGFRPVEED
jgi:hypothetical protein